MSAEPNETTNPVEPTSTNPVEPTSTPSPKPKVSSTRNLIGILALVAALGVAALEYSALLGANAATSTIEKTLQKIEDDPKLELPTEEEVDRLMGKAADGPARVEGGEMIKTYSWNGLLRQHHIDAFFIKPVTEGGKPVLKQIERR